MVELTFGTPAEPGHLDQHEYIHQQPDERPARPANSALASNTAAVAGIASAPKKARTSDRETSYGVTGPPSSR